MMCIITKHHYTKKLFFVTKVFIILERHSLQKYYFVVNIIINIIIVDDVNNEVHWKQPMYSKQVLFQLGWGSREYVQ